MSDEILRVEGLSMRFGGIRALHAVDLAVRRGSITGLIGPNGAGKTTLFNCLTGFYRAGAGSIRLDAGGRLCDLRELLGGPLQGADLRSPRRLARRLWFKLFGGSHLVCRAGLARTFQNIRLFREMSVLENLLVAQHLRLERGLLAGLCNSAAFRRAEQRALQRARYWLEALELLDCANRLAGELAYGQQRRLEIARALCSGPQLLCLDEPAAGLNPAETAALAATIRRLRDQHGLSVLLIEHDMGMVMGLCEHIVVLDRGEVIAAGSPAQIRRDPRVIAAYLGVDEDEA